MFEETSLGGTLGNKNYNYSGLFRWNEIMHKLRQLPSSFVYFVVCFVSIAVVARAQDSSISSPEQEQELIAILQSKAPAEDKAIACKLLAIHGSSAAVPELAKLLPDAQLSSWARISLEAIPGSAVDEALRNAVDLLEGHLLVGTINSIGVRRDADAVDILAARLKDKNAEVASAAAVALGRIGGESATNTLRSALAIDSVSVRSAVAEGCILCAERFYAEGRSDQAAKIYDEVRNANVPKQRMIEATRGAILARNQEGIPLLLEQFRSPDNSLFQLALGTAREFPGNGVDQALADEMVRATPERAALMIQAMADRPETVILSTVLKAAGEGPKLVRLSGIDALGRVGDSSCLAKLLESALDEDADLSTASKSALANLAGNKVDTQILALLGKAKGTRKLVLIELAGQRRIDATDVLLESLEDSDSAVRNAALTALGETVTLEKLSVLIAQVTDSDHPEDAVAAKKALKAASIRMPDREACAAQLSAAFERSAVETKSSLLEILGDVGGNTALKTIAGAAKSNDPDLQDIGSRMLGKWNSLNAAPVLLDLAKTVPEEKYQIRALRGYIGIIRKFDMPAKQRAAMCQQALDVSRRPDEQKLVLDVLKLYPGTETFKLAIDSIQIPQIKKEATQVTLAIAQKLGGNNLDVEQLLSRGGFEKVKLEIIKAEYGAGSNSKDVTSVIQKYGSDLPVITLPSPSYNVSFGGDPLPGYVKQLKIRYRINGKEGEASFGEDSLIILSEPK